MLASCKYASFQLKKLAGYKEGNKYQGPPGFSLGISGLDGVAGIFRSTTFALVKALQLSSHASPSLYLLAAVFSQKVSLW